MTIHRLEREQIVPRPVSAVFEFFSRAENLEQITPPWLNFRLLKSGPVPMQPGTVIEYRLRLHRIPLRWTSVIEVWKQGDRFVDRQIRGPYRLWHHEHVFTAVPGGTRVRDRVHYALPLGRLGELVGLTFVRHDLERIFGYRQAAVSRLLG